MAKDNPTLYLKDYKKPQFEILSVELLFDIQSASDVAVVNKMKVKKIDSQQTDLFLDGADLKLKSITLNQAPLNDTQIEKKQSGINLKSVPHEFELEIITELDPTKNKSYEGLYVSNDSLVTQNEAQGFRKITYFLDRPDVMTTYKTILRAPKKDYPVLLGNGNLVESQDIENDRHQATWDDPHKKPCYLFAIVAGNLAKISDKFTTRSGREVELGIFCSHGSESRCHHAMDSLKLSMKWDEDKYDLEYDLDFYNIVSVDNFNAGAMENKGLNIFNSVYISADESTATDTDYQNIAAVIAHEYFHNWTGNRITLRDWFQLSLKEGLTVFRDQQFSSDYESAAVKRIDDVNLLRTRQFAQDAGPTAHPVRPQSVISVDNFFTVTIYEKGAEVIRMIKTLLGDEAFVKGMRLYFETFDGQAVTTEDFVWSFEEANQINLSQFKLWYDQAGTPKLNISDSYDPENKTYHLEIEQNCPPTPNQKNKKPFHIPLKIALFNKQGKAFPLKESSEIDTSEVSTPEIDEKVLHIKGSKQSHTFHGINEKPIPSFLRGFSAPVNLEFNYSEEQLADLMSFDNDSFARWEAGQKLTIGFLLKMIAELQENSKSPITTPELTLKAFEKIISDNQIDDAYKALLLSLPDESYIAQFMTIIDAPAIHQARNQMQLDIAKTHFDSLMSLYKKLNTSESFSISKEAIGRRSLKTAVLKLLASVHSPEVEKLIHTQFDTATNMTDENAALSIASLTQFESRLNIYEKFYQKWQNESLVMNKWLRVIGSSPVDGTINKVTELMSDRVFDIENPNKVYSLLLTFSNNNPTQFHRKDGKAYEFIANQVIALDKINPHVSSYLATAFNHWKKFPGEAKDLMKRELLRISKVDTLSKNTFEIISKNLES